MDTINNMKLLNMKNTQDNGTYIQLGKQWGYRLETVSCECHWGFKPGLRAPNLTLWSD